MMNRDEIRQDFENWFGSIINKRTKKRYKKDIVNSYIKEMDHTK